MGGRRNAEDGRVQVGRAFFQLLEVLSHAHAPVMAGTDVTTFAFMVRAAAAPPDSVPKPYTISGTLEPVSQDWHFAVHT